MTIIDFSEEYYDTWADLFCTYFESDLQTICEHDILMSKLCPFILGQWQKGIIHIRLAVEDSKLLGFSIYQIDTKESDWCKRPGWGFIREFCVAKEHRRRGIGRMLAADSEKQLAQMGAENIYLTSMDAVEFWRKCGYSDTKELCSNDNYILTKQAVK